MGTKRKCVIVVDDDASIRDLVAQALDDHGLHVLAAATGLDALHYIMEGAAPDLILLDWRMAPMSGRAFAQRYRELPAPHAPIVVVTGAGEGVELAVEIGASGFLRKPFDLQELEEMVARFFTTPIPATVPETACTTAPAPAVDAVAPDTSAPSTEVAVRREVSVSSGSVRVEAKQGEEQARIRRLRYLGSEVQRLRESLVLVRDETRTILETQAVRRLSTNESMRLRVLRMESDRMRLELQVFWEEFETLRAQRAATR